MEQNTYPAESKFCIKVDFTEGDMKQCVLALVILLAGCATDPRIRALDQETARLKGEVQANKISEDEAHRTLDAKTSELYGSGKKFCDVYYSPFRSDYSFAERVFPGCYVEPAARVAKHHG